MIASADLVDEHGVTLCASGATVSRSIVVMLGQRRLRQPLEARLELVPGISPADLADDCRALMRQTPALALLGADGGAALARARRAAAIRAAHVAADHRQKNSIRESIRTAWRR